MLIGIDVGTTAVKASLFDAQGRVLRQFNEPYTTQRPAPGHVEQDPKDWMDRVLRALSTLSDGYKIDAVGLCSQVNTHVFVDTKLMPLGPAMAWQDIRCKEDASEIDRHITIADKLAWWGAPLPIDASHLLARMAFIARTAPDIWQRTCHVLAPKDYCIAQLTGQIIADPMTNFGILDQNLGMIDPLIALVPGARQRIPTIARFTSPAGRIRSGLPCAGVPVVTGAMDAWSGLFGAGVSQNGEGLYLSGTSEILGIVSDARHPTPGVIAFAPCEGITLHAGPTQSGGASAQWIARLLNLDIETMFSLAAHADLRHVPLFLPHLEGERAPIWDSEAKGVFTGLRTATGPAELIRSVLEGVAYSARFVLDSLSLSAGCTPSHLNHSGGGSRSDLWCQIRADSLGYVVKRTATPDAGVLGAALIAGVGIGQFPSLANATHEFVKFDSIFEPHADMRARHDERYALYQLAYAQMKPVNSRL